MPSDERRPLVVQVPLQNSDAFMGESKKNLVILSTVRYALAIPGPINPHDWCVCVCVCV